MAHAGSYLRQRLCDKLGQHPHVGDIRGVGLFCGVELIADRDTKAPLPPEAKIAAKIKSAAFAEGLLCYPMGGTIDGKRGDHILLAPPFVVEDLQLDACVNKLQIAIERALS